jgi:asparagine synthase (glutamine-hydrolysing)
MCAISGILTDRIAPDAARRFLHEMNEAQRHRGPDGEGVWDDGRLFLGHRRLAIIDLSDCGAQPMTNEDGTIVLVCNGEIYNFRELRTDLLRRGHRFRSHTDVEVILHLYEEKGDECVRDLVGMFAFAIWDTRNRHLLLARDRIGEKPLYYAASSNGIAFASELPALLKIPGTNTTIDVDAVAASLIYPSSPAPITMFTGIRSLPPAALLKWDDGRLRVVRYWSIDCSRARDMREREAIEELDRLMGQAVRGSLIADVPVGLLLSGGVDSSAIALYATREGADIQAFSVGYDSPDHPDPDLARARQVSKRLGLSHHEIRFEPVELDLLPGIIQHYAQPFNVFPMLYANQLAEGVRRQATVALGGNGADEAFGGYRGYNRQLVLGRVGPFLSCIPEWVAKGLPRGAAARLSRVQASANAPIEERRGRSLDDLAQQLGATLFTPEFTTRVRDSRPGAFVTEYARECSPREYLDTVMYSDLMVYHQHGTTVITDVSGMTHGLEIRAPFLDHRVLEFAFALPRRLKVRSTFRPNLNKYVLKRAVEGSLPHDVLYGRKYGFGYNIGLEDLLRGSWSGAVDACVRRGRYLELGIFSRRGAEWAIEHAPAEVWRLLVFAVWADLFVFGETPDSVVSRIREVLTVDAVNRRVA